MMPLATIEDVQTTAAIVHGVRVLACASQGSGGDDEARLRSLLSNFEVEFVPFSRNAKFGSFVRCLRSICAGDQDVFVLEGTGVGAGVPAVLAALLFRRPFVLSSGDAIAPFLSARLPLATPVFHLYERLLYLSCSGFIGWTPYLVGRALTMGARRGVTCPGWAPFQRSTSQLASARRRVREQLGIPHDAVVFGIAGALTWSTRYRYCYGMELIRALAESASRAYVLIVGDGSGLEHARLAAGDLLGSRIVLTGRVPREQVPDYLAAMDVGSLPQSVDGVGGFRYTTKIAEYRSVGLPFVTNVNPVSYDLDRGDIRRLPGSSPWDPEFVHALGNFMESVSHAGLSATRRLLPDLEFDCETQVRRVTAFLQDVVRERRSKAGR